MPKGMYFVRMDTRDQRAQRELGEEGSVDVVQVGSDEVGPTGKEERWAQRREQHQHGNTCHQYLSDRPAGADEILATASSRP
ncbi:uncharacterized protein CLUP02_00453 [Colletotrichum lupini]|uniref:Uncharacterized protein n=1 Tax=Colletotrichum lupini TaxID=145971 RepID=A0A9Q8W8C1_9PEZI|nr:uncharacterized protein CLUP02_00453 [Colletotrichum lupini]UQC73806.1 hypothetical protein CLUP02_00453 [Colletotrichum lupini]